MIKVLVEMFTIHARCPICGNMGHKSEMVPHVINAGPDVATAKLRRVYFHENCYTTQFNVKRCSCKGKGWVPVQEAPGFQMPEKKQPEVTLP